MNKNDIFIIHGKNYRDMTVRLLETVNLAEMIGDREKMIGLKPNLVLPAAAEEGAVTHPELVDGVIGYLKKSGFRNICVMEGSWVGAKTARAAKVSGIEAVCEKYQVPFFDLQKDSSFSMNIDGVKLLICQQVKNIDFLINLPVLKGHCQTALTCAMKNLKGLIPNSEKRRFHTMGLHKPIAYLSAAIQQNFILVDNICGDLDFEEGGNPVTMDRIFCCIDPVLCDSFGCKTLGFNSSDVPYISLAERLGVGSSCVEEAHIVSLNPDTVTSQRCASRKVKKLEAYTDPKDACSACYGMLIHALDKMERAKQLQEHGAKICIGQGWKNECGNIGIGSCTQKCLCSLKGCPPAASEIYHFLTRNWK